MPPVVVKKSPAPKGAQLKVLDGPETGKEATSTALVPALPSAVPAAVSAAATVPATAPATVLAASADGKVAESDAAPSAVRSDVIYKVVLILNDLSEQAFDGATADSILRIRQWALPHAADFEKRRIAFLNSNAKKAAGEGKWTTPIEGSEEFLARLAAVGDLTVPFNPALAGSLSLDKLRTATVKPNDLEVLRLFF